MCLQINSAQVKYFKDKILENYYCFGKFYRQASFWKVTCRFIKLLDGKILVRQIAREADKPKLELNFWVHEKKSPKQERRLTNKCLTSQNIPICPLWMAPQ